MKALVVEIHKKNAILLSDNGCIVQRQNKNYKIGQEVLILENRSNFKKIAAYAAAACFILIVGAGFLTYYTPSAYVSFDVNPSIEYTVNIYNRVISAKGVNDDGSEIINEIDLDNLKNKTIDTAISMTVDEVAKEGYLDNEDAGIVITTSSDNMQTAGELAQNLENAANEACEENNFKRVANAEAVGKKRVEEAKELGVTPGKLNLVEKLKDSAADPDSIELNEWLNKSVKDIMAKTKENREQNREQNSEKEENGEKSNNGNGNVKGNPQTTEADSSAVDSGNVNENDNANNNENKNENSNENSNENENRNNNVDENKKDKDVIENNNGNNKGNGKN
ncbi:MAG: anti-sigma-I factor RsgI family protein [Eubacteriales bacterium]